MNWPFLFFCLFLCISSPAVETSTSDKRKNDPEASELKIKVYGYPEVLKKTYSVGPINPLQPETVAISIPGLTIAKLGAFGQKSSLIYNGLTSGDMTFLYDGFEISDVSDPSEGFDLSAYLMSPDFDFNFVKGSTGLFFRQLGGGISVDPKYTPGQTLKTSAGSEGQGLLSYQNNYCSGESCYQIGFGGTQSDGLSASVNSVQSSGLENDSASLYFLSLGWMKSLSSKSFVKVRTHTQYSNTDIDDYDQNFIFKDDKNAKLTFLNQFTGFTFSKENHQFFLENIYSLRNTTNSEDQFSSTERDDVYEVLRTKFRAAHQLQNFELNWSLQNINLKTNTLLQNLSDQQAQNKIELGLQADYTSALKFMKFKQSVNFNALESFDHGIGLSQTLSSELQGKENQKLYFQTQYGYKDRRPSFFQLFDPQFGNSNLGNEKQFYLRPQLDLKFVNDQKKHNISLSYSLEDVQSNVIFENTNGGGYANSNSLALNNITLEYAYEGMKLTSKAFYRQSLDSESVTKILPWTAQKEVGFGFGFRQRLLTISTDIKWLFEMSNPSQSKIQELVQSQVGLTYQMDTQNRISLQLNNVFNDKKIWDEGFNRQPFSWMMTLTKNI